MYLTNGEKKKIKIGWVVLDLNHYKQKIKSVLFIILVSNGEKKF